jgi:hypothetical protein
MTDLTPMIREAGDKDELWMLSAARNERPCPGADQELVQELLAETSQERTTKGRNPSSELGAVCHTGQTREERNGFRAELRQGVTGLARQPALSWLVIGLIAGAVGGSVVSARLKGPGEAVFVPVQSEALPPSAAAAPGLNECPPVKPSLVEEIETMSSPAKQGPTELRKAADPGNADQALANIVAEVGLLDDARKALAAGDAKRALRTLDSHAERFEAGALGQEAEVLRIQALLEAGSHVMAEAKAEEYLAAHAHSPHEKRVRGLMQKAQRDQGEVQLGPAQPAAESETPAAP